MAGVILVIKKIMKEQKFVLSLVTQTPEAMADDVIANDVTINRVRAVHSEDDAIISEELESQGLFELQGYTFFIKPLANHIFFGLWEVLSRA